MRDLFSVQDKAVLITGGSRGIGEMIARGYVEAGANVYISSRQSDACERLAAELAPHGRCTPLPADVATVQGIKELVRSIAAREAKLDILINNAGATWGAAIDDYPEDGWDKVVDLNMKSIFFLTRELLPLLRAAARPEAPARVINITSVHGIVPPLFENYAYSASKAGCIMLTRHLAKRLAREHILVNAIAPGPFPSQMTAAMLAEHGDAVRDANPLKRIGTPEDIAGTAIYLGARASAYLTGAVLPCDGGFAEL